MNSIREYKPNYRSARPRRKWTSITTNITISLNPKWLEQELSEYNLKTIALVYDDLSSALQKLKVDRAALMQSMQSSGAKPKQIALQVSRIDLDRVPMMQAHQMINKIIHERKEVKPWSRFFVDVARMRLDSDAFKALVDEATKLQNEQLENT